MSDAEYLELKASIETDGLQQAIVMFEGTIIDGRHRARACDELGVEPRSVEQTFGNEDEIINFIWNQNVCRRQLTPSQRAALAATMDGWVAKIRKSRPVGRPKKGVKGDTEEPGKTREVVARRASVSRTYAGMALAVKKHAPELLPRVAGGTLKLQTAYKQVQARTPGSEVAEYFEHRTTPPWVVWSLFRTMARLHSRLPIQPGQQVLDRFAGTGELAHAVDAVSTVPNLWHMHEIRDSCAPALARRKNSRVVIGDSLLWEGEFDFVDVVFENPPFSKAVEAIRRLGDIDGVRSRADIFMWQRITFIDEARASWLRDCMPDVYVMPRRVRHGRAQTGITYEGTDNCSHAWFHWPAGRTARIGDIVICDYVETDEECRKALSQYLPRRKP